MSYNQKLKIFFKDAVCEILIDDIALNDVPYLEHKVDSNQLGGESSSEENFVKNDKSNDYFLKLMAL